MRSDDVVMARAPMVEYEIRLAIYSRAKSLLECSSTAGRDGPTRDAQYLASRLRALLVELEEAWANVGG